MSWVTAAGGITAIGLLVALTSTSLTETLCPAASRLASLPVLVRSLSGLRASIEDCHTSSSSYALSSVSSGNGPYPAPITITRRTRSPTKLQLSGPSELQALELMTNLHPFMKSLELCSQIPIHHSIRNSISSIAHNPTSINSIIKPLFDIYYTRADDDLRAVLDNLALLQKAVIVYDLSQLLHERLAEFIRQYRYDIRYAFLHQNYGQIATRVVELAYWIIENIIQYDMGHDSKRRSKSISSHRKSDDYINHVFYHGQWHPLSICIPSLMYKVLQISGAPITGISSIQDVQYCDSPFYEDIYKIHLKVMNMIETLHPEGTPFLSIYPVPHQRSEYTTRELRDLAQSVKNAADTNDSALSGLNLAIESGLYHEFGPGRTQSDVRLLLLQDLLQVQQRLTRHRIYELCLEFYRTKKEKTMVRMTSSDTALEIALIEYSIEMLIEGAISSDQLQQRSRLSLDKALPILRYQKEYLAWESCFIPFPELVEFALSLAGRYSSQLVVDRDRLGRVVFLLRSNSRAGRHLVRKSFVEFMETPISAQM